MSLSVAQSNARLLRVEANARVSHGQGVYELQRLPSVEKDICLCSQDPEGLLSAPKGGHISRRFLQKEVERSKELQAEVDKLKKEKAEELRKQREVGSPSFLADVLEAGHYALLISSHTSNASSRRNTFAF